MAVDVTNTRLYWKQAWLSIFRACRSESSTEICLPWTTTHDGTRYTRVSVYDIRQSTYVGLDAFLNAMAETTGNIGVNDDHRLFLFEVNVKDLLERLRSKLQVSATTIALMQDTIERNALLVYWTNYIRTHCHSLSESVYCVPWIDDIAQWAPTLFLRRWECSSYEWTRVWEAFPIDVYLWTITDLAWVHDPVTLRTGRPDPFTVALESNWVPRLTKTLSVGASAVFDYYEKHTFPHHMNATRLASLDDPPELRPFQFLLPTRSCRTFSHLKNVLGPQQPPPQLPDLSSAGIVPVNLDHVLGGQDLLLGVMDIILPQSPLYAGFVFVQSVYTPISIGGYVFGFYAPWFHNRLVLYQSFAEEPTCGNTDGRDGG
jgi:hypothetical protein